ncbi:MAG: hypothetical protein ACYC75_00350 [Minisyncoccota bacterium]
MYDLVALGAFSVIVVIVLGIAMAQNFISNSPSRSKRAKETQDFAASLGLNYVAEETRALKQKLFSYTRKANIISGKYGDKEILIYDYKTVTRWSSFYGNDPKIYTYVNGAYLRGGLSIGDIRKVIDGTLDKREAVYKNEKWKLNIGMFVLLAIFIFSISVFSFISFQEMINIFILVPILVLISLILFYISYLISKKAYADTPIR